jgi:hypothetical protein
LVNEEGLETSPLRRDTQAINEEGLKSNSSSSKLNSRFQRHQIIVKRYMEEKINGIEVLT